MSIFTSHLFWSYQTVQQFNLESSFNTNGICCLIVNQHHLLPVINSGKSCNRFLIMKVPINTMDVNKTQRTTTY